MHPHVVQACAALYSRIARCQGFDHWSTDQAEEALNELVANPHRPDPPAHQVRNALSNASKKLQRRSALMDEFSPTLTFGIDVPTNHSIAESAHDIHAVLPRLSASERQIIELAADGSDAEDIAGQLGTPVQRSRERLSRARARARSLWEGKQ